MGNRAVITFAPYSEDAVGIYVHWNGGRSSVEGFLQAAKQMGFRKPGHDPHYAMARLTQCITTFFERGLSVGVGVLRSLDTNNGDNGVYVIGDDWEIVERRFAPQQGDEAMPGKVQAIVDQIVARLRAADAADIEA